MSEIGPTSVRSRRFWRINSWPAANGIICSSCAPMSTIEPAGTCSAIASRIVISLDEAVIVSELSSRPKMIRIELAHHRELCIARRKSFDEIVGHTEGPARIGKNFFDADARMHGSKVRFAVGAEAQHAESGD